MVVTGNTLSGLAKASVSEKMAGSGESGMRMGYTAFRECHHPN